MLTNHIPSYSPASFPTCSLKSLKWIVNLLALQGIPNVYCAMNFGYTAHAFRVYACTKPRASYNFDISMLTFSTWKGSIHQHNIPDENLQVSPTQPGQMCWHNAGIEVSTHRPAQQH